MKWVLGKTIYGQVAEQLDTCWQEFSDFLHDAAQIPCDPADKVDHWWCAPFVLHDGATTRRNEDVRHMAPWFALDIEHGNTRLTDIKYRMFGEPLIAYTTASSLPDDQHWRVMVHLNRGYSVAEHGRLFRWFANKFPDIDPPTKNVSRIFFLPACWHGADNVFYTQAGRPIDVDAILAMVPAIAPAPQASANVLGNSTMRPAPQGAEIVTRAMLTTAQTAPEGRRLYRLMCQAATRHILEGWDLTADQLAHDAVQASELFSPGKPRPNALREAQRAIDWAKANFSPRTPLERMRSRILWEQHRFGR